VQAFRPASPPSEAVSAAGIARCDPAWPRRNCRPPVRTLPPPRRSIAVFDDIRVAACTARADFSIRITWTEIAAMRTSGRQLMGPSPTAA